jgi:uncharacterized membrane protein
VTGAAVSAHRQGGATRAQRPGAADVARSRIEAVDLLRGLMVALMVLDHTREYFSAQALQFDPLDLSRTTGWLFATRWVTHLCAPTFVFLAGASVHLQRLAGKPEGALRRQLLTRGLWLMLLEFTVIGFAFNFAEPFLFLQVIWAIGFGMVALAAFTALPHPVVGLVGLASLALTPRLAAALAPLLPAPLWHVLLAPGPLTPLPGVAVYPALPWFGILAMGYAAAPLLACPPAALRKRSLVASALLVACFAVMRLAHVGDVRAGGGGSGLALRILSYVDIGKYPPSLQYAALTLGVSALLLAVLTRVPTTSLPMLNAFGSAPFFTYVLHIFIVHGLALATGLALGIPVTAFTHFIEGTQALKAAGWGFGLPVVYFVWFFVLLILRPLAIRFAAGKRRGGRWWLSYL